MPENRRSESRRVLGVQFRAEAVRWLERVVRPVDRRRQRERREPLQLTQCRESRPVADSKIDAEIHVAGVEACSSKVWFALMKAAPLGDDSRKGCTRAIAPVHVDARCAAAGWPKKAKGEESSLACEMNHGFRRFALRL